MTTRWLTVLALAVPLALTGSCSAAPDDDIIAVTGESSAVDEARSDNVEIKVTVRSDQIARTMSRLRLTEGSATQRDVYFYDTPSLDLFESGVILRARQTRDAPDDSTVKLRPLTRDEVHRDWFAISGFKCETDLVGTRSVDSCSLTARQDRGEINAVAEGTRAVDRLFSSDQEDFIAGYARSGFAWNDLRALGPVRAHVWTVRTRAFRPEVTAERWQLPDGTVILELSTRVPRSAAAQTARDFASYLSSIGVDPSETQETKTRVVLEYFSRRL